MATMVCELRTETPETLELVESACQYWRDTKAISEWQRDAVTGVITSLSATASQETGDGLKNDEPSLEWLPTS